MAALYNTRWWCVCTRTRCPPVCVQWRGAYVSRRDGPAYVNVEANRVHRTNERTDQRTGQQTNLPTNQRTNGACTGRYSCEQNLSRIEPVRSHTIGQRVPNENAKTSKRDGACLTGAPPCSRVYFSTSISPIRYRLFCKHCVAPRDRSIIVSDPLLASRPFLFRGHRSCLVRPLSLLPMSLYTLDPYTLYLLNQEDAFRSFSHPSPTPSRFSLPPFGFVAVLLPRSPDPRAPQRSFAQRRSTGLTCSRVRAAPGQQ